MIGYECPLGNSELLCCRVLIKWLDDNTLNYSRSHQLKPLFIVLDNISNCVLCVRLHTYDFLLSDLERLNRTNRMIDLVKIFHWNDRLYQRFLHDHLFSWPRLLIIDLRDLFAWRLVNDILWISLAVRQDVLRHQICHLTYLALSDSSSDWHSPVCCIIRDLWVTIYPSTTP